MRANIYHSKRWDKKREAILKRDGYLCQISKWYGKRVDATTVHHIYPVSDYPEYMWCDWNLIAVSTDMHNKLHDRATGRLTELGIALKNKTIPPLQKNPNNPWGIGQGEL